MTKKISSILLMGPPRIGKTTVVKKLILIMKKQRLDVTGFFTEEIRLHNGGHLGYDIVTMNGNRAMLARKCIPSEECDRIKYGKYYIYAQDFEKIALPQLKVKAKNLLIIDQIGRMQLLSEEFKKGIEDIFGKTAILATVPNKIRETEIETVERLKADESSMVIELNKKNRNGIVNPIFEKIRNIIQ